MIILAAVAMAAAATASPAVKGAAVPQWQDCGDGLQCAKLSVPVDWARPHGARTEIDLARMPAQDPQHSRGFLVVNTGAASTVQAVRAQPEGVSELTRWFDVVLVEPRGLGDRGSAAAVQCAVAQPDPLRLVLAQGRAGWRSYARDNAAYDKSCRAAAGPAYDGFTSWQVAHDLDALRAELGEPRLRYFGSSYGAVYGQAYMELFPHRVGRMYLEGGPDHTEPDLAQRLIMQARAAERQLFSFRDWCHRHLGCPLAAADAVKVYDALTRRTPLHAGPGRTVNARHLAAAVHAGLAPGRWPELARAMSEAREGDATRLAAMASKAGEDDAITTLAAMASEAGEDDATTRLAAMASEAREGDAAKPAAATRPAAATEAPALSASVAMSASVAVSASGPPASVSGAMLCHDFMPAVPAYRRFLAMETRLREVAPRVGWVSGRYEVARCLGMPRKGAPSWPPHVPAPRHGPTVLVGIGRLDTGARPVSSIPGAVVLSHGDGRDAYLLQGVNRLRAACLRTHVHDYLVNGTLPQEGTGCPGELTASMYR
ncbi:alpha/beta fold hydrolase [Nonomuraea angiospora]|uniref:alpha/beta fold hydrolase n=1 Tax=Nonomuraea angiospora TaxID=46172 RepID=UPI00378E1229